MKRLIALLVLAAVALLPATASAKSRAKVYRGTFSLVGADGDYTTGKFGKAHLVDARRDSLSVHLRRLAPRTKYVFRLQSGQTCQEGAEGGTNVAGWHYRRGGVLKTNRKGVANGSAKARRFKASSDEDYGVVVYEKLSGGRLGPVVLCASLHTKNKGKSKPNHKPHKPHKPHHKPHAKPDAPKPEDKGRGKSEEHRGNSDAAPGHNKAEGEKRATGHGQGKDKPKGNGKKSRR
jgi:hypothetical protein